MNNRNTKLRKCQCGGELRLRNTYRVGRGENKYSEYVVECCQCVYLSEPGRAQKLSEQYREVANA